MVTGGSPGPSGRSPRAAEGLCMRTGDAGDLQKSSGRVVCSQKQPGAKAQPWGELDITLLPSFITGEWEAGEESLKSHVEKKGQLEDELFFDPELSLWATLSICLKPVVKFSMPQFPLLSLI